MDNALRRAVSIHSCRPCTQSSRTSSRRFPPSPTEFDFDFTEILERQSQVRGCTMRGNAALMVCRSGDFITKAFYVSTMKVAYSSLVQSEVREFVKRSAQSLSRWRLMSTPSLSASPPAPNTPRHHVDTRFHRAHGLLPFRRRPPASRPRHEKHH